MNSETIVSDSDAFEASFRNWFWSDDKKDCDAADVIEGALAEDLAADEKVGDEAPLVDVALPNDIVANDEQLEHDAEKAGFLFAETIYIEGEVMDSPAQETAPPPSDHEEDIVIEDKKETPVSESDDEKSVRSITDIIESSLTSSGRELRRSYVKYNYSSDEDDFLKTSSSSDSEESESEHETRIEVRRGRGRPPKTASNNRVPPTRRSPQDKQTEEELVQQIAQETNKKFVCRSCFKSFAYKKCLRNHYESQHPDCLNGPDEEYLLRRVTVTRRKKNQSSDEEMTNLDEKPRKSDYVAQPMRASGHDYQSPVRKARFAKDADHVGESVVSVPTNEPNLPEPNAAAYSIVVTVKGPPSFIKTYSKSKVLTDSIERILHSPSSSPKTIMIVPSSASSPVSSDRISKKVVSELNKSVLPREYAIECNGNEDDDMEDIFESYSLENYDDVEIIYPSEEIVEHPEEIVYPVEDVIEEAVTEEMTTLLVDNMVEDIPYVCNEIVVETEEDFVGSSELLVEEVNNAESPDKDIETENCDSDDVPKRQPVVCLERLGNDIVEQFATRLRPRTGSRVTTAVTPNPVAPSPVTPKEKVSSTTPPDPQRKLRCNVCGWRFKHSYHLRVHLLNHTKRSTYYECLSCRRKFFSKQSYDLHLPKCALEAEMVENALNRAGNTLSPQKITATKKDTRSRAEPPHEVSGEEVVMSDEISINMDTSESAVAKKRVARKSSLNLPQDSMSESEMRKKLRSNQKTPERKTDIIDKKKRKIEEAAASSMEDNNKSMVPNGESLTDAADLSTSENSQASEAELDEGGGQVRKSKRRGASSGAGFYFWMHHGQFKQRNLNVTETHSSANKKRKINGMHSSNNEAQLDSEPVLQNESLLHTEPESQSESNAQKEPESQSESIAQKEPDTKITETKVLETKHEPKEVSLSESGDSEITLRLEDIDDVEADKMATDALDVKNDSLLAGTNNIALEMSIEDATEEVSCTDEINSGPVPINNQIETLEVVTEVTVPLDVSEENVAVPIAESDGSFISIGCEEEEKFLPPSTEASLKLSESTEMSILNSDLSPVGISRGKVDEQKLIQEVDTHNSALELLGLRTEKVDVPLTDIAIKPEVQPTGVVKSDELMTTPSHETDDKRELLLASDTDELNDSTKSEVSIEASPATSTSRAPKEEGETSPTTSIRRKVDPGYYSWLNGEQFSRRKSWSSPDASANGGRSKKEAKDKTHVCETCLKEFKYISNLRSHQERHHLRKAQESVVAEKPVKRKFADESSPSKRLPQNNDSKQKLRLKAKVKAALKNPLLSAAEKKRYLQLVSKNINLRSAPSEDQDSKKEGKHRVTKSDTSPDAKKPARDVSLSREVRNLETNLVQDKAATENKLASVRERNEMKTSKTRKPHSPGVSREQKLRSPRSVEQDLKSPKDKKFLVTKSPKNTTVNEVKSSVKKQDIRSLKQGKMLDIKSDKPNGRTHTQKLDEHIKKSPPGIGRGKSNDDSGPHAKLKAKAVTIRSIPKLSNDQASRERKMSDLKTYTRKPKHENRTSKPLDKVHSVDDDLAQDRKQGYQCKFCDHEFKHYFSWRYHIAMDHGTQTVCCPLCQRWQHLQNDTLEQHLQTHFRREQFDNKAIVQRLVLLLIERRPLPNLEHLGIHYCQWCSSAFGSRSSLEKHQRHEAVNKPHQCPLCGRRFADILQLEPHIISHAQTDSYRCKWCDKLFSDVKSLEFHEEHHSNNFNCDLCQKQFKSFKFLQRHQAKGCGVQNPRAGRGTTQNTTALARSGANSNCPSATVVPARTSNLFDVFGEALSALRSQSQVQDELELANCKNNFDKKPSSSSSGVVKTKLNSSVVKRQCVNELATVRKKGALT